MLYYAVLCCTMLYYAVLCCTCVFRALWTARPILYVVFTMLEDVRSGDQDSVIATLMKDLCLIFSQGATAAFQLLKEKADYLQWETVDSLAKMGHCYTFGRQIYFFRTTESEKSRNLLLT